MWATRMAALSRSTATTKLPWLRSKPFRALSSTPTLKKKEEFSVTFLRTDGSKTTAKAKKGQNLLDVIIDNEVDIDGFGACEGTLGEILVLFVNLTFPMHQFLWQNSSSSMQS